MQIRCRICRICRFICWITIPRVRHTGTKLWSSTAVVMFSAWFTSTTNLEFSFYGCQSTIAVDFFWPGNTSHVVPRKSVWRSNCVCDAHSRSRWPDIAEAETNIAASDHWHNFELSTNWFWLIQLTKLGFKCEGRKYEVWSIETYRPVSPIASW